KVEIVRRWDDGECFAVVTGGWFCWFEKREKGIFPAGMKLVSKHLGKSRSSGTVAGVGSPANNTTRIFCISD
ncbi:putative membrane-associated kinase regulator 5, partial [Trifolium medium]|nr:putative membrane-associated kinase regulator 5 [Trifolium medium]